MFERFTTLAGICASVCRGRTFAEALIPGKRNAVHASIQRANGALEALPVSYNSRVDAGASAQAAIMGDAEAAPFNYIAVSSSTLTPDKSDTTLTGEISSNGLGRAQATYGSYSAPSSLGGSASYTLSCTFTASGDETVKSAAIFNASSSGTMFVEANLSSAATLSSGDALTISWQVNI